MIDPEIAMQLYDPASKKQRKGYILPDGSGFFKATVPRKNPNKAHKGSWLDYVKAHKHLRTAKGLFDLKAISKLWHAEKALDPKIIGYGKDTQWNQQLRAAAQAKRSTQGQTKLTGGASTSRRLSEFYDPKKKDYKEHLVHQVGSYANTGKSFAELRKMTITQLLKLRRDSPRLNDPKPPKNWFAAMFQGIKNGSDVRNPASIVSSIWARLSPGKRASIKAREAKGEVFKYDLPLPHDLSTKGTGTLRIVKPFKLAEVQVNLSVKDYVSALKSGLFSKMRRNDGTTALVARCKSPNKNCNIFIDKSGGK